MFGESRITFRETLYTAAARALRRCAATEGPNPVARFVPSFQIVESVSAEAQAEVTFWPLFRS